MRNELKNNKLRRCVFMILTIQLILSIAMVSFASGGNYAENGVKWLLDQIFWVVLAATVIGALVAATKKATTALVTTIIIGGVVAFLCKSPETISTIGDVIGRAITGG